MGRSRTILPAALLTILMLGFVVFAYAAVFSRGDAHQNFLRYSLPEADGTPRVYLTLPDRPPQRLHAEKDSATSVKIYLPHDTVNGPPVLHAVLAPAGLATLWKLQGRNNRREIQNTATSLLAALQKTISDIQATPRYRQVYEPRITAILNRAGKKSFNRAGNAKNTEALLEAAGDAFPEQFIDDIASRLLINILDQGFVAGMKFTLGQSESRSIMKTALSATLAEPDIRKNLEAGLQRFVAHPTTQATARAFVSQAADEILADPALKAVFLDIVSDTEFTARFERLGEILQRDLNKIVSRLLRLRGDATVVNAVASEIAQAIILQRRLSLILISSPDRLPLPDDRFQTLQPL